MVLIFIFEVSPAIGTLPHNTFSLNRNSTDSALRNPWIVSLKGYLRFQNTAVLAIVIIVMKMVLVKAARYTLFVMEYSLRA